MDQKPKGWRSIPSPFSCLLPPLPERIQVLSWGSMQSLAVLSTFLGWGQLGGMTPLLWGLPGDFSTGEISLS